MGERSAAAAHDRGLSGHVNHVAGRGIGIGARLAMGVIAVAAVTQAGATSAPDADAILQRAFDNYRAGSSATSVAMTVHRLGRASALANVFSMLLRLKLGITISQGGLGVGRLNVW